MACAHGLSPRSNHSRFLLDFGTDVEVELDDECAVVALLCFEFVDFVERAHRTPASSVLPQVRSSRIRLYQLRKNIAVAHGSSGSCRQKRASQWPSDGFTTVVAQRDALPTWQGSKAEDELAEYLLIDRASQDLRRE